MPLIINSTSIDYLNGPTNFVFLTPPRSSVFNYNIILLGDEHSSRNYTPCSSSQDVLNCYDTIQFVELLNRFALRQRVDFYTESIIGSTSKKTMRLPETYNNTIGITEAQFAARNYYNTQFSPKSKRRIDTQRRKYPGEWSDMLILNRGTSACYHKDNYKKTDLCPFKNIYWHFSDMRKSLKVSLDAGIQKLLPIFEYIQKKTLSLNIFKKVMSNYSHSLNYSYEQLLDIFNMFKQIIENNSQVFIESLFTHGSPFYIHQLKKQFDKILPEMKSVVTMESFYKYFDFYINSRVDGEPINLLENQEEYKVIVEILQDLIDIPKNIYVDALFERLSPDSETYLTSLFTKLNTYTISPRVLKVIPAISLNTEIFIPDIYFIMRIFKQESDKFDSNKLIISYMGYNHNVGIQYYLTTFCGYRINYEQRTEPGIRRIPIFETINLNLLLFPLKIISKAKSLSPFTRKNKTYKTNRSSGKGKQKKTKLKKGRY